MIGSQEHAQFIHLWAQQAMDTGDFHWNYARRGISHPSNLPKGWVYTGGGSDRSAFVGPDGVVYKVCFDPLDNAQSAAEIDRFNALNGEWPEGIRPAEMDIFYVYDPDADRIGDRAAVVAAEWVEDDLDVDREVKARYWISKIWQICNNSTNDFYISDLHTENFKVVNGEVVIIDLGV